MTRPPPDYEIDWTAPERRSGMPIVVVFAAFCGVLGFAVGFAIRATNDTAIAAAVDRVLGEGE